MSGRRKGEKTWYERITMQQFMSYKTNPRQRDTEERVKDAKLNRARMGHLKKFMPHHAWIHASDLNGIRYLADAHTRQLLIKEKHFPSSDLPTHFHAMVESAKDMDEVEDHYRYYDSPACVEQASDKNFSAARSLGYKFKSERFKKLTGLGAIPQVCCRGVKNADTDVWMSLWMDELMKLDGYDLPKGNKKGVGKTITAPVLAATVMLINRGYYVKDFLMKIRDDDGDKKGSRKCGAQHFVDWITTTDERTSGGGGYPNVAEKTIACFDLFYKGKMQVKLPKYTKDMETKYTKIKTKGQVSS